jgi:hypothetical protein
MDQQHERRVTPAELAQRLGCTRTWLRMLEKRGSIPAASRDPGSRRKWWLSSTADAIVAGRVIAEQRAA